MHFLLEECYLKAHLVVRDTFYPCGDTDRRMLLIMSDYGIHKWITLHSYTVSSAAKVNS